MSLPKYVWEFLKYWEGGSKITNNPLDRGGLTKYGISEKAYPNLNIRDLTEEQAKEIYYYDYWLKANCENLKPFMRLMVVNAAVNMGVSRAKKILQQTIGVKADGIVGAKTLAAIANYKSMPSTFVTWYATYQVLRYLNIIDRRRSQEVFKRGWIRRTFDAVFKTGNNVEPK